MGPWLDRLAPALLDVGVAAGLLLGLVVLLMIGSRQPARRCGLARAAILGALLLPLLAAFGRAPRVVLPELWQPFAFPRPPIDELDPARDLDDWTDPGATAWLTRTLAIGYVAGATLGLGWLSLGYGGLIWVLRHSIAPSSTSRSLYESLPYEGRGRRPSLRVSTRVNRPVLVGLVRSTILIPPGLDRSGEVEPLRLSLLHELVHAERRDSWFGLLGALAQAVWFFLPPIWWIRLQMRLDQEFLADRHASHGFGSSGRYAASLVDFAGGRTGTAPGWTATTRGLSTVRGIGSSLFLRVLMLVRCPFPMELRTPRWWRWTLLPALAALTVLLSGITFRSAEAVSNRSPFPNYFSGQILISESTPGADGRGRPYTLPFRLPKAFELKAEVLADEATLAHIRVAGLPLRNAPIVGPSQADPAESWHSLRIKRTPDGTHLWIDGDPRPTPVPSRPSHWLSLQAPPDRSTLFRNLSVTW
jgi:hypothetical protein